MADSRDCGRGDHFELKIGGGGWSDLLGNLIELIFFRDIPEDYFTIHRPR
jgi:hypothetical protein